MRWMAFCLLLWPALLLAAPQPGVHPLVEAHSGLILGGSIDTNWVDGEVMGKRVVGGETYGVYSMYTAFDKAKGGKPEQDEAPFEGNYNITLDPTPATDAPLFAVGGDWDALPRTPKAQDITHKAYVDAVKVILAEKGIPQAPVQITQIFRVDLEGDGQEEVFITAENIKLDHISLNKNEYAFMAMRKLVDGKVKTFLLDGVFGLKDVPKDRGIEDIWYTYNIQAFLDINGDGKLEIINELAYYEGRGFTIHQWQKDKMVAVFAGGWCL